MTLLGIDVSRHQTLAEWSPDGLSFLIAKATEGSTFTDPMYAKHIAKAKAAGLITGAYHFGNPVATIDAQVEAFLRVTGGVGLLALDVEAGNMTITNARRFVAAMHERGKLVGLYHSASGYPSIGQDWRWVAHWGVTKPSIPYHVHQYRGSPLDLDRTPLSRAQLLAFSNEDMIMSYPVPKVPSVGDVPKGGILYTTNPPIADDPKRIIIDPTRTVPWLGTPSTGIEVVEYVDEAGTHTGRAYFVKSASLVNRRAVAAPPPTQAQLAAAKLEGARQEYDAIVAAAKPVETLSITFPPRP